MEDNQPPPAETNQAGEPPAPEVLKTRTGDAAPAEKPPPGAPNPPSSGKPPRRRSYRPSHKATFLSLGVVAVILLINVVVLAFVLRGKSNQESTDRKSVTISPAVLDKLGVNTAPIGNSGAKLTVGPDAEFKGKLAVGGNVTLSGPVKLNGKVDGSDASFAQLQAGNTALSQLNVNGDGTLTNLNLRSGLAVKGTTQLQGAVTINGLVSILNSLNISGNTSIGGVLTTGTLNAARIVSGSLSIGGHVTTSGQAPSVSAGSGVGSNGTVSISGNDTAGTVAVNIGVGGGDGIVANVSFRSRYGNIPHVVITPVGSMVPNFYITRSASGFSIGVSGIGPGGYAFDYIVAQ